MTFPLSSALLEACVLAVLSRGDSYGYELTQGVRQVAEISESTLYPVLRRLQQGGYLDTYDQPYQGRNRRYYTITPGGRTKHRDYLVEWLVYKRKVGKLLSGGTDDE